MPAPGALVMVAAAVIRGTIRATPKYFAHSRAQQNVPSGQVAVDDGRRSLVEVGEAAGRVV